MNAHPSHFALRTLHRLVEDPRWREIGRMADQAEVRAYAVGGCVRDLFLQVPTKDLDVTVEGDPKSLTGKIAGSWRGRVTRYERFGTASVETPRGRVDVAMARSETYRHPGALPEVRPATLQEDLFRRDFTINAVAIGLHAKSRGIAVDPVGGLTDLAGRRIRVLHALSFLDDPTRLFRAVRYEQRYGFSMDRATLGQFREALAAGAVDTVSDDRWYREWEQIFHEDQPWNILHRLGEVGALPYFGLNRGHVRMARSRFNLLACAAAETGRIPSQWWGAALVEQHPGVTTGRFSARTFRVREGWWREVELLCRQARTLRLLAGSDRTGARIRLQAALRSASEEAVSYLTATTTDRRAARVVKHLRLAWRDARLSISGEDLKAMGVPPGPVYRRVLEAVRGAVAAGKISSGRESERRLAKELVRKIPGL